MNPKYILKCMLAYMATLLISSSVFSQSLDDVTDDNIRRISSATLSILRNSCDSKGYVKLPKTGNEKKMGYNLYHKLDKNKKSSGEYNYLIKDTIIYYCFSTINSREL